MTKPHIIENWDKELKRMNKNKVGKEPFRYPNTFLLLLGYAKVYFHLPYRQTKEGIAQGHAKVSPIHPTLHNNKQKNKQIEHQS